MNQTDFASLDLPDDLLKSVISLGYEQMTPIQAESLPHILAGNDVIGQAKTGSGKTAAFGLGILQKLDTAHPDVQALVLCPTRELADQVANAIRQLARTIPNIKLLTLSGGMPFRSQALSLEHGAHIIVGTPGRIAKHLRKKTVELKSLTTFILDEGDRMLEMGFQEQLDTIIEYVPRKRQTLLFSATYPTEIQSIAKRVMVNPVMVKVASTHDSETIQQHFYKVSDNDHRLTALRLLLMHNRPESTVIFCTTRKDVITVADKLSNFGFNVLELHGDLDQRARDEALVRFSNKSVSVLVATDVASRGLDIESLDAVINYHIALDVEVHVHRIGRTGRAGSHGMACSLYSEKEQRKINQLEEYLKQPIEPEPLPPASALKGRMIKPPMATLKLTHGKKQKMRAGNILGALTGDQGLSGDQVGKIHIAETVSYVAVTRDAVALAIKTLSKATWKGNPINAWLLGDHR